MSMNWRGELVKQRAKRALIEGLQDATEYLLDEADKIVPHRKGILEQSGTASYDRENLVSAISYGGAASAYARRLHEHPEYNFKKGRKGKWLEITFKEKGSKVQGFIRNKLAEALKG